MPRLLNIHAHPDDEASKGAPTVAKCVAAGHSAYLVCATGGEQGDILNKAMDRPEIRDNLTSVRADELHASMKAIGYHHLDWLGYEDSGMADSEANKNPACFAQADFDEAVERFAGLLRRHRPHVVVTYSDVEIYRHPDHLMVHDISGPAVEQAADPGWESEAGPPWQVQKLYYSIRSRAMLVAWQNTYDRLGLESPFGSEWFDRPSHDDRITTNVDISGFYHVRRAALLAHATQVDPEEKFWFGLPDDAAEAAYPYDDYILAHSTVDSDMPETDLFAGVVDD